MDFTGVEKGILRHTSPGGDTGESRVVTSLWAEAGMKRYPHHKARCSSASGKWDK